MRKPCVDKKRGSELMELCQFREGTIDDLPFLKEMLYEAVFWNSEEKKMSMDELYSDPEIAKILHIWKKRDGDFALVAMDDREEPVGAVWYRFWTENNRSYGYVDEETPEIAIAVVSEYRSRGLGTELLRRIMNHAREIGIRQLSLSVEKGNYAINLFEKVGFKQVSETQDDWIMVKSLDEEGLADPCRSTGRQ
jgi:ribosomal protein S18 acetylase RimI-like enzyme